MAGLIIIGESTGSEMEIGQLLLAHQYFMTVLAS